MYQGRRVPDWVNAAPDSDTTGFAILNDEVVFRGFDGQEESILRTET
jgi:hypothetical protein